MTVLRFGRGWRDPLGRERDLAWLSDVGWVVYDNGQDVEILRRGVHDELGLRARLLGWEDMVDDADGPEWVISRICYWATPSSTCLICQGEGWVAGHEGMAVACGCVDGF